MRRSAMTPPVPRPRRPNCAPARPTRPRTYLPDVWRAPGREHRRHPPVPRSPAPSPAAPTRRPITLRRYQWGASGRTRSCRRHHPALGTRSRCAAHSDRGRVRNIHHPRTSRMTGRTPLMPHRPRAVRRTPRPLRQGTRPCRHPHTSPDQPPPRRRSSEDRQPARERPVQPVCVPAQHRGQRVADASRHKRSLDCRRSTDRMVDAPRVSGAVETAEMADSFTGCRRLPEADSQGEPSLIRGGCDDGRQG